MHKLRGPKPLSFNPLAVYAMSEDYFPPAYGQHAFHCPFCGVKAKQHWLRLSALLETSRGMASPDVKHLGVALCDHCGKTTVWVNQALVFPASTLAPPPNRDLPADARATYEEASEIAAKSPRGAAALLRLALQQVCVHLGLAGKNLNDDIAALVARGLDPDVQIALDSLRVIGNNAVHPLELDLRDDQETAISLFNAVNFVAEQMITNRSKLRALFEKLPEKAKEAIKKRDG